MGRKRSDAKERIYEYLLRCADDGVVPTVREICDALAIKSTSTVHVYLRELDEDGRINRPRGKKRSIQLPQAPAAPKVPLLGVVTAGVPIQAVQNVEDYISVPFVSRDRRGELFALHVRGRSMIDAGIESGDIIVVRQTSAADNGDIVVADVDGETTVKRFYREKGHIRLQPENPDMQPIIVDEAAIIGVVITLIRKLD